MSDHADIEAQKKWWRGCLAERAIAHFRKRHLDARYASTAEEALGQVLGMIPGGATVGWGDSVTLHQVGILSALRDRHDLVLVDPFERNDEGDLVAVGQDRLDRMREAMRADVFLSGVNAVTLDGKLVSTDATGNRVAPTIFGPKQVIIVAGVNKIVNNLDEAFRRIKEIAAPINSRRHLIKHRDTRFEALPCARKGVCTDCLHPDRICCYTVIIEAEREPATVHNYVPRLHLVLVGEELGI